MKGLAIGQDATTEEHLLTQTTTGINKCFVDNCESGVKARGLCGKHWTRWRRHGDPEFSIRPPRLDLAGHKFGRLVAIKDTGSRKQGQSIWLCECECGRRLEVQAGNLRSGNTKSCGCLQREAASMSNIRHGGARAGEHDVEYTTWWSMIARCKYASTHAYPWYGGKGISVCDRWLGSKGYSNFLEDMGRRPGSGWSIDRIDPEDNYKPSNCRWLPMAENSARAHRKQLDHWK